MTTVQECQECGKKFSCETYLEYHRTVSHSPHHLTCGVCQKHFPTKKTVADHMMAHVRGSHSCNICGDPQNSGFRLYVHLVTSHSAAKQLRCALCDRECSNDRILKQHLTLVHTHRISRLSEMAELYCTVHSARSFPEEDLGLDVLLSQVRNREEDVRFEQNESVAIANGAEPMQGGPRLARSQQNESKSIENRVEDVCFQQNGSVAVTNGAEPMRGCESIARSQKSESKSIENRIEDVRFEPNGSVAITNGAEPIRGSARLARSQQNESTSIENREDFTGDDTCFACSELEDSAPIENKVEPMWGGALFQNSKLHGLVPKAIIQKTTPLVVVIKSPSSKTKLIPHTRIPLRELNKHDPAGNSKKKSEGHPTDIPIEITHDAQEDAERLFLPDYSITFSQEQERTLTVYTCETCGMKSEDKNVFLKSHQPHPDKQSKNYMICLMFDTSQN